MFEIGRPWTAKEKQALQKERKRKEKIKNREILLDTNEIFVKRFHPNRTWFILPLRSLAASILDSPEDGLIKKINLVKYEIITHREGTAQRMFLQSFSKEEEFAKLETLFNQNQIVRFAMKKLLLQWKLKRTQQMNEEDILTLEPPKKKITLYSSDLRKKYIFEAHTLLKDCITRLTLNEEFFPIPLYPRNPFTNEALTYTQVFSIHKQLRSHGCTHWIWEAFYQSHFCLVSFIDNFSSSLKIHSVNSIFSDVTNRESQMYVADFIQSRYILKKVSNLQFYMKVYDWVCRFHSSHPYLLKWRILCCKYWKIICTQSEYLADSNREILLETQSLMRDTISFNQLITLWSLAHRR
jgi:hypothetical protein